MRSSVQKNIKNECGKKTCRTRRIMTFHATATTMKAPTMTRHHNNEIGKNKYGTQGRL